MKRLDLDRWPPLISIAVLLICSGLLWAEYQDGQDLVSGEILGRVVQARGTLQRKARTAAIFQNTRERGDLHSGDTLRTSHSSRAVIRLNSGIRITLGEFSMVQLTRSRERLDVNLNQGSIRVRSGGRALRVRSGKDDVSLKGGEVNLKRASGSGLSIEVRKGNAEINSGGRTQVLKENQRAEIKGGRIGIKEIAFRLTGPEDGALLFAPGSNSQVRFDWTETVKASRPLLRVARDADFKQTALALPTQSTKAQVELRPGAYYWRLESAKGNSETRFFIIKPLRPARLLKPEKDAVFHRVGGPPRVDFAWIPGTTPADYTLELSRDADFRTPAQSLKCNTTGMSLELEPGRYFWRVQARLRVNPAQEVKVASAVNTFRVEARKSYARPVPAAPKANARVSLGTARSAGVLFSWRGSARIVRWEWSLAEDAAFTRRVQSAGANRAYALLKGPLREGYSYWRVRGFDAKGRATPYSLPVRFLVVKTPALKLLGPAPGANIISPGILFRWQAGGASAAFRFQLAQSRDMKKARVTRVLYGRGLDLPAPPAGKYFWRVDIVRNGRVVAAGPIREFTIPAPPATPDMLLPAAGKAVDMSLRDRLDFRWRPVKNASRYRLRLYQLKGGKRIRVFTITSRTPTYSLRDLSKLDIGEFVWSVTSLGAGGRESAERLVRFRVELRNRPAIPRIRSSGAEVQ